MLFLGLPGFMLPAYYRTNGAGDYKMAAKGAILTQASSSRQGKKVFFH
jgi:hypothetical protein